MPGSKHRTSQPLLSLQHGKGAALFYGLTILFSYALVWNISPSLVEPADDTVLVRQTFLIFCLFSFSLSLLLFFMRSTYRAAIILFFRCYLIMIQGYGQPGFFTVKLILGIALLLETGIILQRPYNWIFSGIFTGLMIAGQVYNPVFGHSSFFGPEVYASPDALSVMLFLFTVVSFCINMMIHHADVRVITERNFNTQRASMIALAEFNANLQAYAQRVGHESSDRERNRISREIHDISGYIFTNLIALLNAACSIPADDQEKLSEILITARKQAREGLKETRTALRKTRETPIPEEEGVRAIHKIVQIFQQVTGVRVQVNWGNIPHSFSRELNFVLYRTIQEALTNAYRHGMATAITIHFLVEHRELKLSVVDNGKGAEEVVKGIGLTGMQERIGNLDGQIRVSNASGGGFSLNVTVPLDRKEKQGEVWER
ncbi:MAG: sensor histidine kinase [Spirochaetales bacterium]|nr:sensor histidine kinase [Spirochaetales bacterium]